MTVNKGLSALANKNPNFSNQGLENAINEIKAIDKDDGYLFIKSQFDVDTAIRDNTVLTQTQKNDALETLYNAQPHLQIGRYLTDIIRHTNTILDGTIVFLANPDTEDTADFLEILQTVQSLQTLIPSLYGVSAAEKNRSVNDHLGTLNNIFLETEDSSAPVFTRLTRILTLIRDTGTAGGGSSTLAIGTAAVRYSNSQLVTFLGTLVADSTDFQTSLDNAVNQAAGNMSALNTRISDALAGDPISELQAIREEINAQVNLETSNLSGIRDYVTNVTDYQSYIALAEDDDLRGLMTRISQTPEWITYFENYVENFNALNPIYTVNQGLDRETVIDQVLASSGLPDVVDFLDLKGVADKSQRDDRIDNKGYDFLTVQQQITKSCDQLGLETSGRTIYDQSERLLKNMNQHDRDTIAKRLDLNDDTNTLS